MNKMQKQPMDDGIITVVFARFDKIIAGFFFDSIKSQRKKKENFSII